MNLTHLGQSAEGPDDPPRRRLVDPDAEHDAMVTAQMEDERMAARTPQADSAVRQNLVDAAILEGCREEVAELLADEAMGSMRAVQAQRRFLDDLHALSALPSPAPDFVDAFPRYRADGIIVEEVVSFSRDGIKVLSSKIIEGAR